MTMSMIDDLRLLADHPLVARMGWTLVHFIWQGAAIAAALGVALLVARRASPQPRYLIGCAALLLSAACLPATFFAIGGPADVPVPAAAIEVVSTASVTASTENPTVEFSAAKNSDNAPGDCPIAL